MSNNILRIIEWYCKKTGKIVGSEEIRNFDLAHFKLIFNHTDKKDPNIYGGSYDLQVIHVKKVQSYLEHKIDLKKFDYEFSTYQKNKTFKNLD